MAEGKTKRLSKVAREFNIGIATIVDFLNKKGHKIESNPNTKIAPELYNLLVQEYSSEIDVKKESEKVNLRSSRDKKQEIVTINDLDDSEKSEEASSDEVLIKDTNINLREEAKSRFKEKANLKILGKIDIDSEKKKEKEEEKKKEEEEEIKEEIKEPDKKVKKEEKPKEEEEKQEKPETTEQEVSEVVDKEKGKEGEDFEEEQEVEEEFTTGEEEIIEEEDEPEIIESESLKELKKKSEEKGYEVKVVGKIDLDSMNQKTRPARKSKEEKEKERIARRNKQLESEKAETPKKDTDLDTDKTTSPVEGEKKEDQKGKAPTEKEKISGPTIIGKISLPGEEDAEKDEGGAKDKKKRRKRIKKDKERINIEDEKELKGGEKGKGKKQKKKTKGYRHEISEEDVEKQIKDTLARLTQKGKSSKGAKYRREKRDAISQKKQEEVEKKEQDKNVLKVTEFVSVSELANMMSVSPTEVIQTCMNLGLFVSINQRLDAETMALVADEFNYKVDFISVEVQEAIKVEEDEDEQLLPRPPIVTVMGHVDHGKTKLLDHIRKTNVIAGEAGGITQHIGAYNVSLHDGRQITFLDTPGHEAFTAMRARGAQVTDIAIIVVAADDGVKPQTVEAINHAHAAGVPIVFAINKIDKPTANPEKIKEELANMNFLVEDWGGKYQSQEISAKNGVNIDELMEKVLLEAELLELKANPEKRAYGTVVESSLDRGRGYTATVLVEAGTLSVGDVLLAGSYFGHVKAMYNEREKKIEKAGPSMPVLILGLNGAPQAGDKFNVMESDREAKEIANKREQLQREQGLRTQKHITLDEIGRRIAIGNFQELNIIVKGDFDGSVEALSDSLIKLSTEEIQVNIIHKAVGQISEMDIMLAVASNAIVVGFQVRPSLNARKLAEKEEIEIRLYSIIYDAIEEVKMAMEGMLTPEIKEEVVATVEVQEVFKISKVGTVAGCLVRDGKINRNSKVRVIRDGIVVYTGNLGSLKRFKDDVKEVSSGFECGLNIENYNDIKVGDMIEAFREVEVKKKL